MSDWDVNYHRKELEKASGKRWGPIDVSISRALTEINTAKLTVAVIRSTIRFATGFAVLSTLLIIGGVLAGLFSVFGSSSSVAAMIVPGVFFLVASLGARLGLALSLLPPRQRDLLDAEEAYRASLDRAVA